MAQSRLNIAQYFTARVTQGSADAFAQQAITTGLLNTDTQAIRIIGMELEMPSLVQLNAADYEFALYRRTKAAMPDIRDPDVVKKFHFTFKLTTSGSNLIERCVYWNPPQDSNIIIVEDPIYFAIDTGATSAAASADIRIDYEFVGISQTEKLQLLARTLGLQ